MHNYCKGNWPPKMHLKNCWVWGNRFGITGVKTSGAYICESVRSLTLDQSAEDLSIDAAGFNQVVKMHSKEREDATRRLTIFCEYSDVPSIPTGVGDCWITRPRILWMRRSKAASLKMGPLYGSIQLFGRTLTKILFWAWEKKYKWTIN